MANSVLGAEVIAYAMVDLEKKSVYAMKWVIKSNGAYGIILIFLSGNFLIFSCSYMEDYFRVKPLLNND
jgi:hypothetical protein